MVHRTRDASEYHHRWFDTKARKLDLNDGSLSLLAAGKVNLARSRFHNSQTNRNAVDRSSPCSGQNLSRVATIGYEPEWLLEKTGDALGFPSARIEGDLKRFRDYIEERRRETGCWRGQVGEGQSTDLDVQPTRDAHLASEKKASTARREATGENTIEVPLSEEEVKVGKRTVGAGEVKLHKTVTTEQVNVLVELKREDIVVERVAAHEVESGEEAFQEEVIKIPLSREEPVIEKEVHVTGGVRLRKTEGVDKETIRETVRRENVDVDESGKTTHPEKGTGEEHV